MEYQKFLVQMEIIVKAESLEQAVEWSQYTAARLTADPNCAGVTAIGPITAICQPQESRHERQEGKASTKA